MPRIPLVEPESAPQEIKDLYAKFPGGDGQLLNVVKMFGNNRNFLEGFLHILNGLYSNAKLPARYRELAYLRASQLNSCHY
ncbi:MAG: carboxymuconolactone decarboxylase family protein [Candidatus Binataceae bacterium]